MAGVHTDVHLEDEIMNYLTAEGRGWVSGTLMNCIEGRK